MIEELQKVFEILNLSYDENKDRQYQEYMEGILEWNEHVNLTAIKDRNEFIEKHYIDSLLCAGSPEFRRAETIIDVGTGGGFPNTSGCRFSGKTVYADGFTEQEDQNHPEALR